MVNLNLSQAIASNMENLVEEVVVNSLSTDGVSNEDETTYTNEKWPQFWGYFNEIAELKAAIIMKAIWNVGKGYTCDPRTEVILDSISGCGKDTFDDILFNMEIIKRVGRESFCEIIRDSEGNLINLKPLDPGSMRVVFDKRGIIKRYEQINKLAGSKPITFKPNEIFHLINNRLADQIHGVSDIESLEKTILAENESFTDMKKIMHRQARPMIMFKLGTDDPTKIQQFVDKMDLATSKGENIYIPDDANSVSYEVIQVNVSQMVLEWRNDIRKKFYRAIGLPELLPSGGGDSTESGGKIGYLCFEQIVERDQRYLEKQIWNQLGLRINLIPPASIDPSLQADQGKDANQGLEFQPSDTTAGAGK